MQAVSSREIHSYNLKQLEALADDCREEIVAAVRKNGGHLSSNLGVVELTLALHFVFDFPKDKLLFDVGHQCYAHKLVTGRAERFSTIRQKGGLSGFPDPEESEYDAFIAGHSGASVATGIGFCHARDLLGGSEKVICLIGDASLSNGLALEALFSSESKPKNFIVILNDNGMSIGKNTSALYSAVSKMTAKRRYRRFNSFLEKTFRETNALGRSLRKVKRNIKRLLNKNAFFERCGFKYIGPLDGHNLSELVRVFEDIKHLDKPAFVHVVTQKGHGMELAEQQPSLYHGIGADLKVSENTFSERVSAMLCRAAEKDERVTAVCAAMRDGVGLNEFSEKYPARCFDAGICESYAVTMAAGMAKGGLKPVVCIYSTFLQRAYDQIVHDVCIQNLPVVFLVDRAGLSGADGKTHQGMFDTAYLRSIPNLKVFAPKDDDEAEAMFAYALSLDCPVALRYPNGKIGKVGISGADFEKNRWEVLEEGEDVYVLASGARSIARALSAREKAKIPFGIVNARTVVPLDEDMLERLKDKKLVTFEESYAAGGFGGAVAEFFAQRGERVSLRLVGAPLKFIAHAKAEEQAQMLGVAENDLLEIVETLQRERGNGD